MQTSVLFFIGCVPVRIDCETLSLGFRLAAVGSVGDAFASPLALAALADAAVLLLAVAVLLLLLFVLLFPFVSARRCT